MQNMDPGQWLQTGDGHFDMGRFNEAIHCYGRAVEAEPGLAAAWNSMGAAFQEKGDSEKAVACYEKAIERNPELAEAHFNLGMILQERGKWDEAVRCYRNALTLKPDRLDALNNLGNIRHEQGRLEQAVACFRGVIAADPTYARAYNNLGKTMQEQGKINEAIRWYEKAVALRADYAQARFNLSLARLTAGDFAEGWKGFEWRFRTRDRKMIYPHVYGKPRWQGSPFPGERILVHAEQGLGDTIQFIRYLPWVKARGGTVVLEALKPLHSMMQDFPGIDELVNFSPEQPASIEFDLHVPLLSLPGIFGTNVDSIPVEVPYLSAAPEKALQWREQIRAHGLRVGIVWAGKPTHGNDRNRSVNFSKLLPLLEIPGISFFGLQKGPAARQAAGSGLWNLGEAIGDFSDTAGAMENLDLVISVDTAVAHLAGAMGKPVWLLLPKVSDWRWLLEREDSPWYPTMRLFRQKEAGNWELPIARISQDLKLLADKRRTDELNGCNRILEEGGKNLSNGRLKEAEANFFRALREQPRCAEALHGLGLTAYKAGHYRNAEIWIQRAVSRKPCSSRFHNDLGLTKLSLKGAKAALGCFRQATEIDLRNFEARYNLALSCKETGLTEEAAAHFRMALELRPNSADAAYNLANSLLVQGIPEESEGWYRKTLHYRPDFVKAWNNLGLCLKDQGRVEEALEAYEQAIARKPDFVEAHWNRALAFLLRGDLAEGWKGYECRFSRPDGMRMPSEFRRHSRWDGSSFAGKRLLVWAEQGFGDTIQFIRYLPLVRERGGTVVFQAAPPLHGLLQGFPGIDELVFPRADNGKLHPCDLHVPLMSLPKIFGTRIDSIPAKVPYLFTTPEKALQWGARITGHGPRVGIVWAGKPEYGNDCSRSVDFSKMLPLLEIPGVSIFGLQKGPAAQQAAGSGLRNLGAGFRDFSDTAGAVANLNMVISVDTAVAHLAAAMGKPVWLLLPFIPDWRWLLEREDSPWYPTMRLFRQEKRGDWAGVFKRVEEELKREVKKLRGKIKTA